MRIPAATFAGLVLSTALSATFAEDPVTDPKEIIYPKPQAYETQDHGLRTGNRAENGYVLGHGFNEDLTPDGYFSGVPGIGFNFNRDGSVNGSKKSKSESAGGDVETRTGDNGTKKPKGAGGGGVETRTDAGVKTPKGGDLATRTDAGGKSPKGTGDLATRTDAGGKTPKGTGDVETRTDAGGKSPKGTGDLATRTGDNSTKKPKGAGGDIATRTGDNGTKKPKGAGGDIATRTGDNGTKKPKGAATEGVLTRTDPNGDAASASKSAKSTPAPEGSVATRTGPNEDAPTKTKSAKSTPAPEGVATRTGSNEDAPAKTKSAKSTPAPEGVATRTDPNGDAPKSTKSAKGTDANRAPAADDGDAPSTIVTAGAISNTYDAMTSNDAKVNGIPFIAVAACAVLVGLLLAVVGKKRRDKRRLNEMQKKELGLQNLPEPSGSDENGSDDVESGKETQPASWDTFAGKEPIVVDAENRDSPGGFLGIFDADGYIKCCLNGQK